MYFFNHLLSCALCEQEKIGFSFTFIQLIFPIVVVRLLLDFYSSKLMGERNELSAAGCVNSVLETKFVGGLKVRAHAVSSTFVHEEREKHEFLMNAL